MKSTIAKLSTLLSTAALIVTAAQSASAIEYRFKFKATSSGPDIYACNAGLRTQPIGADICYKELSDGSKIPIARPGNCDSTATVCESRVKCVSRGIYNGESYMNYMKGGQRVWTDHSEAQAPRSNFSIRSTAQSFQPVVPDASAMDNKIEDLLIFLGNEVYTGQYFVDICYRAPQHEFLTDGQSANFAITSNVGSTDFTSIGETHGDTDRTGIQMLDKSALNRYTQVAGVKVQVYVVCDTQGQGSLGNATNSAGVYNTSENEANFTYGADGLPNGGQNGSFFMTSSLQKLTGDSMDMLSTDVGNLRFCKVRYMFTETAGLSTNPGNFAFRNWKRGGAEMCTFTDVNEPVSAPTGN